MTFQAVLNRSATAVVIDTAGHILGGGQAYQYDDATITPANFAIIQAHINSGRLVLLTGSVTIPPPSQGGAYVSVTVSDNNLVFTDDLGGTTSVALPGGDVDLTGVALKTDLDPLKSAAAGALLLAAGNPDGMVAGPITRDAQGAALSFAVTWPDGATGTFTGVASAAFPGAVDSYTITHVLGGVTQTYVQSALTRDGNGAVTTRPAITVVNGVPVTPVIPTAPTLSTSAVTATSVTVSGVGGSNVASLTLARGATQVATSLPYTDTGLSANTAYTYTITVTSSTGHTATSTVSVTTALAAPTAAPTATLGTSTVTTQPLTWTAVTGATAYDVEHKATSGSTWTVDSTAVTGTSYTVTGLTASTSYDYRVRARNSGGTGPYSTVVTATTQASGGGGTGPVLADNFTAANGTAIEGRTLPDGSNTAKQWIHLTATNRMEIQSNAARAANAGIAAAFASVDGALTAYKLAAQFPVLNSDTSKRRIGLIFRAQSDSNYFRVDPNGGTWLLRKIISGTATTLLTGPTAAAGDSIEVTVNADNTIALRINGTLAGTTTAQTDLATVTNVGFYGQGNAGGPTLQDQTSTIDSWSLTGL